MHAIWFVRSSEEFAGLSAPLGGANQGGLPLCISASKTNHDRLTLRHYKEQYRFFLPSAEIQYATNDHLSDNELSLHRGTCDSVVPTGRSLVIPSEAGNGFHWPVGFKGELAIHY